MGLLAGVAALVHGAALAQISKPTEEELDAAPAGFQAIVHGKGALGARMPGAPSGPPPPFPGSSRGPPPPGNSDPRDLSGSWSPASGNGMGAVDFGTTTSYQRYMRPGRRLRSTYELARLCRISPNLGFAGQVLQTGSVITLLNPGMASSLSGNPVRRIFLDRPSPAAPPLSFGGTSVGHWDGATLVVETTGFKPMSTFGYAGKAHVPGEDIYDQVHAKGEKLPPPDKALDLTLVMATPTLKVTEKIRKIAPNRIQDIATYADPTAGMKPYTIETIYALGNPDTDYIEFFCEDGNDFFGAGYVDPAEKLSSR